jgi:hypothetical protein
MLCPFCGHTFDAASSVVSPKSRPRPGDFSVCIECVSLLTFDDRLRPTIPPASRKIGKRERREIEVTMAMLRAMHRTIGVPPNKPHDVVPS